MSGEAVGPLLRGGDRDRNLLQREAYWMHHLKTEPLGAETRNFCYHVSSKIQTIIMDVGLDLSQGGDTGLTGLVFME